MLDWDTINGSPNGPLDRATSLTSNQIDEILSMTLIANLATLDDGGIHVVPVVPAVRRRGYCYKIH